MALAVTLMATSNFGMSKQGDMLSQLERNEIQTLFGAGFSPSYVAQRSGASGDTVRRIAALDNVIAFPTRRIPA